MLKLYLCSAFFLRNYLKYGIEFLQVIYEAPDCDLTQEFFDSWF